MNFRLIATHLTTAICGAVVLMCSAISTFALAEETQMTRGVIRLDETVISGNQELPKVLYILPWRDPNGLPEIDLNAEYSEMDIFRPLYPPAYRRELTYFKSLEAVHSLEAVNPEE